MSTRFYISKSERNTTSFDHPVVKNTFLVADFAREAEGALAPVGLATVFATAALLSPASACKREKNSKNFQIITYDLLAFNQWLA